MLKLTKMLSLAGTLMVLGSINSAQGAVIGEPPVVNPNNGNPVEEITGLQVLNSDGSLIEIFTVNFQFDSFVTTFGDNPSSEAFFLGNTTGAISALTAINNAMNGVTSTIPTQVVGTTSFNSDPNVPIVPLGNYRIPATLDLNANEVATIIGQFTNDAWGGGTTQIEVADGVPPNGLVMYAKFTKTGEISAIPESSNLVSLLVFGTSLLFVAKNRIG